MAATPDSDPWNFWVFSVGVEWFLRSEDRAEHQRGMLSLQGNRTTDKWKLSFDAAGAYRRSDFEFDDGSTFRDIARDVDAGFQAVKSLGDRWGIGAGASVRQSSFFNLSPSYRVAAALEYNLFPYSMSSQKQATLTYFLGGNRLNYQEETIFLKKNETLVDQGLILSVDLRRPWGSAAVEVSAVHFLQHSSEFNLEFAANVEYRIVRGLSLELFGGV